MAYNTRPIKKDVDGRPIPQYFNAQQDEYQVLQGDHGAARSILYGPDGNPISTANPLGVRARELEALIGALNDSAVTNPANAASVIAALKGLLSVVGKEATLGQILLALGSLATESTLASLASSVAKEATLSGVKSAVDTLAGTVSDGAAKVTLSGSDVQIEVTQLLNAEPLSAGASIAQEFDLQTYGELVVWVAIDRQYRLQFYQQLTRGSTNLPIAVTIADNVSPPPLGRTHAYNITQYLPTHTGRLLVVNLNTTETATVSLWIGRVKRL